MTTDALKRLIEAIDAGDESDATFFARMMARQARDVGAYWPSMDVQKAYGGDLNAAKALHDALLPGWWWEVARGNVAKVQPPNASSSAAIIVRSQRGNPARAWLLAILKAKQAETSNPE